MSNALMMAIVASLRPVVVSAPKVSFVAPCAPVTVAANPSISLAIPGAAQAGDVLLAQLLHFAANSNPPTTSGPTGSVKVVSEKQFKWYDSTSLASESVYLVRLTSSDIATGSVTFGLSASDSMTATGAVFRDVSESMLDSADAWGVDASSAVAASPVAFSAPGFTTTADGAMLVTGASIADASPPNQNLSVPAGFTLGMTASEDYSYLTQIAYAQQAAHGATPAAPYSYSQDSTNPIGWCAWQLSLKAAAPAITLSATFPTTTHVGDTVSFDVVATLVDGATGTPTITVDQLPDGLMLGGTSMVDATTYKATVSGTLTTVQDITSTFGATGGSVAATPMVHAFSVQAAGSMNVVQIATTQRAASGPPIPLTLASVKKDDLIVAVLNYNTSQPTWVFNVTDTDNNVYGALASALGGGGARDIYTWSAIAANDVTNLEVDVSIVGHSIGGMFTLYQIRGGKVVASDCVSARYVTLQSQATDLTSPAFNVADGGFVIAPSAVYISAQSPTFDPILPSAGTYSSDGEYVTDASNHLYCGNVTGTGAQTGMSITWTHNPASYQWRATCVVIPVNPA